MVAAFENLRLQRVLGEFGIPAIRRSSVCHEFEDFLRRITAGGRCCLEIGTYHGISAMILAQYFDRVVTITIEDDIADRQMKHRVWDLVGARNIDAIEVANENEKAERIAGLDFDFAYLDGDHVNCTESDFALTQRCGHVLFHEYWPLQPPVWRLVNSLPRGSVIAARHDCLAYWRSAEEAG